MREKHKDLGNRINTVSKHCQELQASKDYEKHLPETSKLLRIDENDLDNAFNEQKGELVKKFMQARGKIKVGLALRCSGGVI